MPMTLPRRLEVEDVLARIEAEQRQKLEAYRHAAYRAWEREERRRLWNVILWLLVGAAAVGLMVWRLL